MFERTRDSWRMTGRKFKIRLFFVLALIVLLLLGLVWVLRHWQGGYVPDATAATPAEGTQIRKLEAMGLAGELDEREAGPMSYAERKVLDRHFSKLGGVDLLAEITSLRVAGKLQLEGGEEQDIIIVKKSGDMLRIVIKTSTWRAVSALTPDDAWRALWNLGTLVGMEDLDPKEAESMKRYAYVTSELFMALQNSWEIKYAGQKDFNYKMAHVFEVQTAPNIQVRFFVDPTTFLDVGREEREYDEDGKLKVTRHLYSDHLESNDLMVPGKIETYVNEVLSQTFIIEKVDVNPGILESGFARPVAPAKP